MILMKMYKYKFKISKTKNIRTLESVKNLMIFLMFKLHKKELMLTLKLILRLNFILLIENNKFKINFP
jgi:hypothetical protein